ETLRSLVRRIGPLPVEKAVVIGRQVLEGLIESHRQGIVHRDLKPQNIMLDLNGDARIMDFGIARSVGETGLTAFGASVGTPQYMSPEQAEGLDLDGRSDLYAWAVSLYEMLTGQPPFEGKTAASVLAQQQTRRPPDPRKINPAVPEALSRIILKCLAKDRDKRYPSAEALLLEVKELESGLAAKTTAHVARAAQRRLAIPGPLWLKVLVPGLIILMAGAFFILNWRGRSVPSVPALSTVENEISIAVPRFVNSSNDPDLDWLCLGLATDIAGALARVGTLIVHPPLTASLGGETVGDPAAVRKSLGADYLLSGTVGRDESGVKVTVRLFKLSPQEVILTRDFFDVGTTRSNLEVQNESAVEVAKKLSLELRDIELLTAVKRRERTNAHAYSLYYKGRWHEWRYRESAKAEDFKAAVEAYTRAIAADQRYALAYWGLGNIYEAQYADEDKGVEEMMANYRKAYRLDRDLPESNLGMGWYSFYKEDLGRAAAFYRRALQLAPRSPEVNVEAASFLRSIGLFDQSIDFYQRAIDGDPQNITNLELCAASLSYVGDFDQAAELLRRGLVLEPENPQLRLRLAHVLQLAGDLEAADRELTLAEKTPELAASCRRLRCLLYALRGEKNKALEVLDGEDASNYFVTNARAVLGLDEEAVTGIRQGVASGFEEFKEYTYTYRYLENNPFLWTLRTNAQFQKILAQQKKTYEKRLRQYSLN
ncbi:MAG: protein kinase, partial [Candidatus Aminicenantes bacterium]|nr:protein kinase [Candidatus Aminicenantes bacterium]